MKFSLMIQYRYLASILFAFSNASTIAASSTLQDNSKSDSTTFLAISDLHISAHSNSDTAHELLDICTNMAVKPTFIISVGDQTDTGRPTEYERLKDTTANLEKIGTHLYAVPGSRDVRWCAQGKEALGALFGKQYQSFDRGGIHFVLLDSTVMLQKWGHFDKVELDWLSKDLKRQKADTPVILFLHHSIGIESPFTRPIDNEYDFWPMLKGRHIAAIFNSSQLSDTNTRINGIPIFSSRGLRKGSYYKISYSPLLLTVDLFTKEKKGLPLQAASIALNEKLKPSVLRAGWDDPAVAFLERRRPAVTLDPRAIMDNPDKELAEYRIDEGIWNPMARDARDVWRDVFQTKGISIGEHIVGVQLTTSNRQIFMDELIFEVERDEKEATRRWAVNLEGPVQSSPLLDKDTLYTSSLDGKLTALDTFKGKRRWAFTAKGAFVGSPILSGNSILAASTDHGLYAIDSATGHQKWRFDVGSPIYSTPAEVNGVVVLGSDEKIQGIDAESGRLLWTVPAHGFFQSRAASDGATAYLGGWDGALYAVNAKNGSVVWTKIFGTISESHPVPISPGAASPAVMAGRVYVSTTDGVFHALNSDDGSDIWHTTAPKGGDQLGYSSPTLRDDKLLIAGTGEHGDVYCFDPREGHLLWRSSTGQMIADSSPSVSPDGLSMAIMGVRGRVSVLSCATGKRLWGYELGPGNIFSSPMVDGSTVYTTTMANDVQAISAPKP